MRHLILIVLCGLLIEVNAQLVVTTGTMTPTQYVQNVLIGGGVTVSNVTFTAPNPNQIGTFDATNTNPFIGINNGLIMASGDINVAIGPNNNTGATLGNGTGFGVNDPDLDVIAGIGTNDAAVLEFDFIPTGDTVKFKFVFGSEEYPEYVNSINDAFGFFLSGPGIAGPFTNGAENIALVPGTTTPVTINTVNSGSNASYYVDNNNQAGPPNAIQFDGYTTVMTAIGVVQCGQQYHIKIAIADASDDILDSGVFLEAGSFSSNTISLSSNVDVGGNDSILYEGCGQALLDFVRSDTTDTSVYYFTITGSAGPPDYNISADSVLFLPGEDSVTITFDAIQDGLGEPMETVTIELVQTICNVQDTQRVTFYIADFPIPILTTHDTLISCGSNDSVPIWVDVNGPPHTILWNTGETTDTIWVQPATTTTYYVTVSDTCGVYAVNDSALVSVFSSTPINLTMPNDMNKYCPQDSMSVYVSVTGGGGGITYSWSPSGSTDSSIYVSPNATTTYIVTVQDVCGTVEQDSVTITVPVFTPLTNVVTTNDTTICPGEQVILDANINGGVGSYYSWNNGLGSVLPVNVNPLVTTTYILTAEDSCGAMVVDSVTVTINTGSLQVNVSDYTMNCLNEQVTLTANVTGTTGNETYLWNTGATTTSIQVNPLVTTTYTVTVTNTCSSYSDSGVVTVPVFNPINLTVNSDVTVNCPGDEVVLNASYTGGAQSSLIYNWTDGTNNFTGNNITVNPTTTTTYTVWVNDTCAFDGDTASFTVTVPVYGPLQLITSQDIMVCVGDTLKLFAAASGGSGGYMYDWGGQTSDTITINPYYDDNYNITVTDACGNQISGSVMVTVTKPTANFTYEYLSEYTVEFEDSSYSNIVANWWSFDPTNSDLQLNPTNTFITPGEQEVWLAVEDINGCRDTVLKVITPPIILYAPNTFTPDGNGMNDVFKFEGIGIKVFNMLIYNRWGELLFQSGDIEYGWDGTYKGKLVPTGVYIYRVKAMSYDNVGIERTGNVNVIR